MLPTKNDLSICFAHPAYQLQDRFHARETGISSFEVRTAEDLKRHIGNADVLVVSGMWNNDLIDLAKRLRFIQSISAGVDQYARSSLEARGIRLASAQGVNSRAVSEHALSLILALTRRLHEARDNQRKSLWRGMISDLGQREDELGGKTIIIVGLGGIGSRLAKIAKVLDLRVIGVKRDVGSGGGDVDEVRGFKELDTIIPEADFVVLTCPLTDETENLINARRLALMKGSAFLVNVARGRCVHEAALIEALEQGHIAGAALDVTAEEPLRRESPLWTMDNVLLTPHSAGETRRYEDNVIDLLLENLERLWRREPALRNQVV